MQGRSEVQGSEPLAQVSLGVTVGPSRVAGSSEGPAGKSVCWGWGRLASKLPRVAAIRPRHGGLSLGLPHNMASGFLQDEQSERSH